MNLESLSRCTAQGSKMTGVSNYSQLGLTRPEVLAALSGISTFAMWWVEWKILDDQKYSKGKLERVAVQLVRSNALKRGWGYRDHKRRYDSLAVIALKYAIDPIVCPSCKQDEVLRKNCEVCCSLGFVLPVSVRREAGIKTIDWFRKWSKRYQMIESDVLQWVASLQVEVIEALKKQ